MNYFIEHYLFLQSKLNQLPLSMNFEKDPLGKAMNDYFEGIENVTLTVYSDVDGEETMEVSYFFRNIDDLPKLEKLALTYCKGKILDIGAGAGCHSLILQSWGLDVTAIDVSPGAVDLLKKRGIEKAHLVDVFEYEDSKFDTLLMLMNGVGIGGSLENLELFLEHSKKLLKPTGQIIFDSSDIIDAYVQDNGAVMINLTKEYYGIVEYQLKYKDIVGEKFKWLYVDAQTLAMRATLCGFDCEILERGEDNSYIGRMTLL